MGGAFKYGDGGGWIFLAVGRYWLAMHDEGFHQFRSKKQQFSICTPYFSSRKKKTPKCSWLASLNLFHMKRSYNGIEMFVRGMYSLIRRGVFMLTDMTFNS